MKVIICCSQGITSFFMKRKLNEYIQENNLDIQIEVSTISKLLQNQESFDKLLISPQVKYELENLKKRYADKEILCIPTEFFDSMNVEEISQLIQG